MFWRLVEHDLDAAPRERVDLNFKRPKIEAQRLEGVIGIDANLAYLGRIRFALRNQICSKIALGIRYGVIVDGDQ